MLYYGITACVVSLIAFCLLRPRAKVLIAFFVMTSCFDLVPRILFKVDVWDVGAVLLLIAWLQLALGKIKAPASTASYVVLLKVVVGWMVVCLLWSVLIYDYPLLNTVKASRQMIIGVLSFFVFRKLFAVDEGAYDFFMKTLYITTFALLPICLLQFVLHKQILFGLYREYGDVTRSLPVFLPLSLLHLWVIISKFLTASRIAIHEFMYAGMVVAVMVITFTRGIYLTSLFALGVMLLTLALKKSPSNIRLNFVGVQTFFFMLTLCGAVAYSAGYADKAIDRFNSAVDLVFEQKTKTNERNQDTYTGRLGIVKERFMLVLEHNPVVGYGFIHEDNVPSALKAKLRYGSVIYTPEYVERYKAGYPYVLAFHSADIGWADIIINTGIIGLALWLCLFAAFVGNFYMTARVAQAQYYNARLGHFLQISVGILLMFESNTFVSLVQIPAFMLAGYWYCEKRQPELLSGNSPASMQVASASM